MMLKTRKHQKGQATVLIALAMIALIGFIALAIDGGSIYLEQRRAQNAADAALFAVGRQLCADSTPTFAELEPIAQGAMVAHGLAITDVTLEWPISSFTLPAGANSPNEFYRIRVNSDAPKFFVQLVYQGPWEVNVEVIGRCRPPSIIYPAQGNAIVSLAQTGQGVFRGNGNGNISVFGGGVQVNSSTNNAVTTPGNGAIFVEGPLCSVGTINNDGDITAGTCATSPVTPAPDPLAGMIPVPANPGSCQSISANGSDNITLNPGCYSQIRASGGATIFLNPGVYYMTGEININGGNFIGSDVFFYMTGMSAGDDFSIGGSGNINLLATDDQGHDYRGLLVWMLSCSAGDVAIAGGGTLAMTGTVYAPCAEVSIQGGGQTFAMTTQIISDTVQAGGGGDATIIYDPAVLFTITQPPAVEDRSY